MFNQLVCILFDLVQSSDWLWVDKDLHFLNNRGQGPRSQKVKIQKLEYARTQFWIPWEHQVKEDAKVPSFVLTFESLLLNNTLKEFDVKLRALVIVYHFYVWDLFLTRMYLRARSTQFGWKLSGLLGCFYVLLKFREKHLALLISFQSCNLDQDVAC